MPASNASDMPGTSAKSPSAASWVGFEIDWHRLWAGVQLSAVRRGRSGVGRAAGSDEVRGWFFATTRGVKKGTGTSQGGFGEPSAGPRSEPVPFFNGQVALVARIDADLVACAEDHALEGPLRAFRDSGPGARISAPHLNGASRDASYTAQAIGSTGTQTGHPSASRAARAQFRLLIASLSSASGDQ